MRGEWWYLSLVFGARSTFAVTRRLPNRQHGDLVYRHSAVQSVVPRLFPQHSQRHTPVSLIQLVCLLGPGPIKGCTFRKSSRNVGSPQRWPPGASRAEKEWDQVTVVTRQKALETAGCEIVMTTERSSTTRPSPHPGRRSVGVREMDRWKERER